MLYGSDQFGSDARFGNDGNTVLLLQFHGANASTTFKDSSKGNHTVAAVGNAQISTAQYKFDGSSYLGDGTGDYLTLDGSSDFAFGTGDFTIDCWIRPAAVGVFYIIDFRAANGAFPTLYYQTAAGLRYFQSSADRISGTTILSTNTWYHIALTRAGTSTKLFLNGTQEGSTYTDSTNYSVGASRPAIGIAGTDLASAPLNGHMDGLRIMKGFAAWTANFTPPPMPYGL